MFDHRAELAIISCISFRMGILCSLKGLLARSSLSGQQLDDSHRQLKGTIVVCIHSRCASSSASLACTRESTVCKTRPNSGGTFPPNLRPQNTALQQHANAAPGNHSHSP